MSLTKQKGLTFEHILYSVQFAFLSANYLDFLDLFL